MQKGIGTLFFQLLLLGLFLCETFIDGILFQRAARKPSWDKSQQQTDTQSIEQLP